MRDYAAAVAAMSLERRSDDAPPVPEDPFEPKENL